MSRESVPTALGSVDSYWDDVTNEHGVAAARGRMCGMSSFDSI
jgi:hypothetical protein